MAKFRQALQQCHVELIGWSDVLSEILLAGTIEIFAESLIFDRRAVNEFINTGNVQVAIGRIL